MVDLLILFLLNSFFIVGFHLTTKEGEINHWVDKLLWRLPEYLKKPLYDCVTCMASVHSTYIFWYNYEFNQANILLYIAYVFGLAAFNTLFYAALMFCKTNIIPDEPHEKNK